MRRREWFGLMGTGLAVSGVARPLVGREHDRGDGAPVASPLGGPHAHFCGIHVAKSDPSFQLVVQHYCTAHAGEGHGHQLYQCLLFDSSERDAKLLGVEYIITDECYRTLPSAEQKYWHPHTYEVLSGGLIAPAMNSVAEMAFMKHVLTTWGKTWHTWPDPRTDVPLGEPMLVWSLGGDGQVDERLLAERDRRFGVSAAEIRARRVAAIGLEVPCISPPRSLDQVGRQWTDEGADLPTRRK
jgi:hypothetical protein